MVLFVASCVALAAGVLSLAALARGHSLLTAPRPSPRVRPGGLRQLGLACSAGAGVWALTRWPAAALATGGLVALWPKLTGGSGVGQRTLEKLEALATWTESLRDTAGAASGLEQAIPATVQAAPAVLRRPLRDLAARLDGRVPLPEALAHFADDVDDPAADMVVAALSLNSRQRAGGLERILTALAVSARSELEMHRTIEHERRGVRRQAQRIALGVVGFAVLQAVFSRTWVEPYGTPVGQVVLTLFIGAFLAAFWRLRALANPEQDSRFLTHPELVTDVASYRPRRMS